MREGSWVGKTAQDLCQVPSGADVYPQYGTYHDGVEADLGCERWSEAAWRVHRGKRLRWHTDVVCGLSKAVATVMPTFAEGDPHEDGFCTCPRFSYFGKCGHICYRVRLEAETQVPDEYKKSRKGRDPRGRVAVPEPIFVKPVEGDDDGEEEEEIEEEIEEGEEGEEEIEVEEEELEELEEGEENEEAEECESDIMEQLLEQGVGDLSASLSRWKAAQKELMTHIAGVGLGFSNEQSILGMWHRLWELELLPGAGIEVAGSGVPFLRVVAEGRDRELSKLIRDTAGGRGVIVTHHLVVVTVDEDMVLDVPAALHEFGKEMWVTAVVRRVKGRYFSYARRSPKEEFTMEAFRGQGGQVSVAWAVADIYVEEHTFRTNASLVIYTPLD
eukprot:Hpha_TRINITY_DN16359_c3_g4::TRINITY_DN16359_c3_g4_i2::g.59201::m.59201